jgi:ribose-phosphate pyrophosphokinase
MKIITGNANPELAQEIADHSFATLVPAKVTTFADGETSVEFLENIRGEDVFIIQSTATPVNDSLMELLIMIDAAKRSVLNVLQQLFLTLVMLDKTVRAQVVRLLQQS